MRKMRNSHGRTWNMVRNTEKLAKWKTHTIGSGILQEIVENVKNEKYPLQDLDYGKKNEKTWKMRQKHCRTLNMGRNTEKRAQ